jgi:hypothetical protein
VIDGLPITLPVSTFLLTSAWNESASRRLLNAGENFCFSVDGSVYLTSHRKPPGFPLEDV